MNLKQIISLLLIFICTYSVNAQVNTEADLTKGTLNEQFKSMLDASESYKIYKVIRRSYLDRFKSNINDSIGEVRQKLIDTRQQINDQQNEIASLKSELNSTNENLSSVSNEKDSISFLGIPVGKSKYKSIMWSIAAALLGGLLFFFYRFYKSNQVTSETQKNLDELHNDFDSYKKRAIEKEQKIMRRLQDELNKR